MSRKFASIWIILVCLTVCLVTANAQDQKPETLKIDTALVSVPVIVSDRQGRYISGLKMADFTLYEDRTKRKIDFFADVEEPITVALLLDTSKSTVKVLDDIKKAAKDFVKQLRPQDRAMIVTFDHNETALCELTSDRKVLEKAIGKVNVGEIPGTKLRDAVNDVMTAEFKSVKGRKAIILLTDGKDHGSEITEQALLDSASEADTLIYSVFYMSLPPMMARNPRPNRNGGWRNPRPRMGRRGGIFMPPPRFPLPPPPSRPKDQERRQRRERQIEARNEDAIDFLEQLTEVSAGRYYDSEVANLKKTFEQVLEELRHQYRLGFYPSENATNGIHTLQVEVARPDVVVRSRRSYRAAGQSTEE